MALSNLDATLLFNDLDALSPRSNTTNDSLADQVAESPTGQYETNSGTGGEIVVDANNKKIYFQAAVGNNFEFAGSGITGQALYSFLKYLWKNVESITKFDFPMLSITNEQFEFSNGWYLDDTQSISQKTKEVAAVVITDQNLITTADTTVDFRKFEVGDTITITGSSNAGISGTVTASTKTTVTVSGTPFTNATESTTITAPFTVTSSDLLRTAGWTVKDTANTYVKEIYSGFITLGTFVDQVDQPYYVQSPSTVATVRNAVYTGPANQAVAILSRANTTSSGNNLVTDIAFTAPDTISSTTTDLSVFKDGDTIVIAGSPTNDGTYLVDGDATATSLTTIEQTLSTETTSAGCTITADRRSTFNVYVRERGKTYADASLADIGVTTMTYIVYRFPVTNASDIKITTTADTDIDSNGAVPADVNPFDDIQIEYLEFSAGVPYDIKGFVTAGTLVAGEVYKDTAGDWFKVTVGGDIDAAGVAAFASNTAVGPATLVAYEGEREISNVKYAFDVIIDANDAHANAGTPYVDSNNNTTVENVYEFAQWALRRDGLLNEGATGASVRNGAIAELLVEFVGDTLVTKPGVFIDSLASIDQNQVQFNEASNADYAGGTSLAYPRVVTVNINFNSNLATDGDAVFYVYYSATPNGETFGENDALQVKNAANAEVGTSISNNVPDETVSGAGSTYSFAYAYDADQTGGRTIGTDVDVVAVAIGLNTGQYVKSQVTAIEATGATISLVAPLERNFSDPV